MRPRGVRRAVGLVVAAASVSLLAAGPANAGEQVCIPFNGPTLVVILDKEYWLPGHSLPCQDVG